MKRTPKHQNNSIRNISFLMLMFSCAFVTGAGHKTNSSPTVNWSLTNLVSHSLSDELLGYSYHQQNDAHVYLPQDDLWNVDEDFRDRHSIEDVDLSAISKKVNKFLGIDRITKLTLNSFLSSFTKNLAMQFGTSDRKTNEGVQRFVELFHDFIGYELNAYMWGAPLPRNLHYRIRQMTDEDVAVNPDHFLLFVICVILCTILKRYRKIKVLKTYFLCIIIGFMLFCLWINWTPYSSRRQLPLFVLGTAFVAVVLEKLTKRPIVLEGACVLLLFFSYPWVMHNSIRPLKGKSTVFNTPRNEQYFRKFEHLRLPYNTVAGFIEEQGFKTVGIFCRHGDTEYPLLALLKQKTQNIQIEHVGVENISGIYASNEPFIPDVIISMPYEDMGFWFGDLYWQKIWAYGGVSIYVREDLCPRLAGAPSTQNLVPSAQSALSAAAWRIFHELDAQMLKNGRFLGGMDNWHYWQYGGVHTNKVIVKNNVLTIENPYRKLIGIQQPVNVVSGVIYRLSGVARSVATTQSDIVFGGRIAFYLLPQKERQLVWTSEYDKWSQKELTFTNKVTGTASILVHLGYGNVGTTGEFTNIRLEQL